MLETIKAHPVASGAVVLVGVLAALWLLSSGNGGSVAMGPDPSTVAAGTALQAAQMQSQTDLAALNLQLKAGQEHDLSALEMARIDAASSYNLNTLLASVESQRITTGAKSHELESTLNARVAEANFRSQENLAQISGSTTVEMQRILGNIVSEQYRSTERMYANQQQTIRDTTCSGFFDCLF